MTTTVHGYPRIGPDRELKRACEDYWAGRADADRLDAVGARLRRGVWETLRDAGVAHIPSNTFSYYDHVLDTAVLFDAVPPRFAGVAAGRRDRDAELRRYFAMARGAADAPPLEMTKWFDTNYHYLVPELGPGTRPRLAGGKPLSEYTQARGLGIETRPVLLGPLTFLMLAKPAAGAPEGWRPLELLDELLACYAELLGALARAGAQWVQLDEPILATDAGRAEPEALRRAVEVLGGLAERPRLLVSTYFGPIGHQALEILRNSRIEGVGLDLVSGPESVSDVARVLGLPGKTLVAGVVDGRNVWRSDVPAALSALSSLLGLADEIVVGTSCSLLHVPIDLDAETGLDPLLRERLAFARQKVDEVVLLGRALAGGDAAVEAELERARTAAAERTPAAFRDQRVRARLDALGPDPVRRRAGGAEAESALPPLPTTTIGSFPQTGEVRGARADLRAGRIDRAEYERRMRAEIDRVIALQEDIGLDVLVHGEPERNDMVQYFAEQLDGYATTQAGWVQSYGSRCVRPPILYGDVHRPAPMTVGWITYAQSRTAKPVKGMLTGPVTMLAWSFVRDDQPLADTARQVALALRDEIADLERAGIRHIQVDEAALRELLPLRADRRAAYLAWAVGAFRLATSGVAPSTRIHSHMCYSEFGDIVGAIEALDADVTSVEAARSRMELVDDLAAAGYARGIGPGVYDIHAPRVPSVEEIEAALRAALRAVPPERLWVNPDCGLKTRGYAEVEPALRNLVAAARRIRAELAAAG
ncbi:5-methyltetrahydropteroyltriglutamate--homocysteine S-methyltransferase [Marinitenerispora sediminis]|uniref:5-methyltetrahydropteroyltriglutamate-- homocysteine S-methyltransferase n=1 Tax=Marinitenerispora sediminis TaxID=1931232 RepID=UPI000DF11E6D|nr:5-methyltetrahydropteroyltriglutamate--homocysteine S-methyltransferase [Marinitenerispora sediminis]RCV54571.1 5-methyltetrahydropteroyltriglutamate--homocysteine S-methyltransferase [Marinitenerispora sediminis]